MKYKRRSRWALRVENRASVLQGRDVHTEFNPFLAYN